MSIYVDREGREVTVVVPMKLAVDSKVRVKKCPKLVADEECNWCITKYACSLFVDSPEFSLKDFACRVTTEIT